MVDLARKNLLHDKLRFFITISGVAFAVTLVMVQVGLFLGLLDNASVVIEHADADLWVTSKNTPNVDFAHPFFETLVSRVRSTPGVKYADNLILTFMDVALPNGAQETSVIYALEDFKRWNLPWRLESGHLDNLRSGKYVAIDTSATKRFGSFALGDYREYLGQRLKISAITQEAKSFTTTPISFMRYGLAQAISGPRLFGKTTYILVKLEQGANLEKVRADLKQRLPYNDVYTRGEWAKRSRAYWVVSTGLGFNMVVTVFLGCLVGIVVVAQTLYTSTMEHIKEFGTVKAIGGSNRDIYRILGWQAIISAVIGFFVGLIPTFAMGPVVARGGLHLLIPPSFIMIVFVGTLLMCLLAAMVSFRKVAAIDPALVFRG